jgi:outer membrane protein assembly factor BamD
MIRRCLVLALFLICIFPAWAQEKPGLGSPAEAPFYEPGKYGKLKKALGIKQKAPTAEEPLYKDALAYYEGKPTRLAKKYPERAEKAKHKKGTRAFYYQIDYERCITEFQKLIYDYPFTKHLADANFYIADSHFKAKEYEVAIQAYQDFLIRHPKDPRVEYAHYQIALCHWKDHKKNPLRDQTETEAALEAFKLYETLYPAGKFKADADKDIKNANINLSEREVGVGDFYFQKKEFWSASLRYHHSWIEYPDAPKAEYSQYREAACYEKLGRTADAVKAFSDFAITYPKSKYLKEAHDYLNKHKKAEPQVEEKKE